MLVKYGEMDWHAAVDGLWLAAGENGLMEQLGADGIQAIMASAFAEVRR